MLGWLFRSFSRGWGRFEWFSQVIWVGGVRVGDGDGYGVFGYFLWGGLWELLKCFYGEGYVLLSW